MELRLVFLKNNDAVCSKEILGSFLFCIAFSKKFFSLLHWQNSDQKNLKTTNDKMQQNCRQHFLCYSSTFPVREVNLSGNWLKSQKVFHFGSNPFQSCFFREELTSLHTSLWFKPSRNNFYVVTFLKNLVPLFHFVVCLKFLSTKVRKPRASRALALYEEVICDNYVPQWWVEFDDELSWLFTKRFRTFCLICRK